MIITITGKPGSGKSTIAQRLADALHYKRYYIGQMRRDLAKAHGLTLEELNELGEHEDWTDRRVDSQVEKIGQTEDNFVLEGRTAFHFIPQSVKLFFDVSDEEGARRLFNHLRTGAVEQRNEARDIDSLEDIIALNQKRMASDKKRYEKYYHIDAFDPKNFDLWLDTTKLNPDQVFEKVLGFVKDQAKNQKNGP